MHFMMENLAEKCLILNNAFAYIVSIFFLIKVRLRKQSMFLRSEFC